MKTIGCVFLLLVGGIKAYGQNTAIGYWFAGSIVLPGDSINRWGACLGSQSRFEDRWTQLQYLEANGGLTFFLNKNFTVMTGFGRYETFTRAADQPSRRTFENRLYEQVTNNQLLYRLKIEHRYQVEQRWSNNKYNNRFRYRLSLYVPVNHIKVEEKTWFLAISDELFLNNRSPGLTRNRVSAGCGYQFTREVILQTGWINQYDESAEQSINKNYTFLTAIFRIHRKNGNHREFMPSSVN
jgi:hypothetical protein